MKLYLILPIISLFITLSSTQITPCNQVFSGNSVTLLSPNYPHNYASNLHCEYKIKGSNCPTYFKLNFLDFQLENSLGCTKDRLVIENQDALCGKGPKNPEGNSYLAPNGTLSMKFITDEQGSASGFNISIENMGCEVEDRKVRTTTTEVTDKTESTSTELESTTLPFKPFHLPTSTDTNLPNCCPKIYNSRRFLITSPNFPKSLNTKQDCIIKIQKADTNICRLRLEFLYFYLGTSESNNCPYGQFEIDGKLICGCNRGLKLTTSFEYSNFKIFIFKTNGNINTQAGFVIEVIQDDCPTKYYPENQNIPRKEAYKRFIFPKSEHDFYIEQAQLINERKISKNSEGFSKFIDLPKIIKSFYFFADPEYNAFPQLDGPGPTTFIDTSTINSVVTNFNSYECTSWNKIQFEILTNKFGSNLQTCQQFQDHNKGQRSNCIELNYVNGYLRSPGYPYYYPKNLHMCYRFIKQTGYCGVKLLMTDFQLENSYRCYKDYILLENGSRYCGNRLFRQTLIFNMEHKNFADMIFVSDRFFCGRGFYAVFEQIPCQTNPGYPTYPEYPQTRPECPSYPEISTTTTIRPTPTTCNMFIDRQSFILEVNEDRDLCIFQIRKYSENVCKINLYFEKFNLYCGDEVLELDNTILCGDLSGRKYSVNFDTTGLLQISYRSSLLNKYDDSKFRIIGEQITDDCLFPEPAVQRIINMSN